MARHTNKNHRPISICMEHVKKDKIKIIDEMNLNS